MGVCLLRVYRKVIMVDLSHLFAITLTLGAAVANASQNVFVRKGTDKGKAFDAVMIVMLINSAVLIPGVVLLYYPEYHLTRFSWISFIGAGLFGTLLGRMLTYTSIDTIGASRTAPIVASQALFATVFGILVLGESLTPIHGLGIILIVSGVSLITWETSHNSLNNIPRRELLIGLIIPFGAAIAYGAEPIFASTGFNEGTPAPVGLAIKTASATLGFTLYLRWKGTLPAMSGLYTKNSRWFVLAGISNTLFLVGYYVALEIAPVNVVVPVLITNTLFTVFLSAAFLPKRLENVTWKIVAAATIVVVGVVTVTLQG
ncbi:EamA family transporter [Natrialba sp. INN-245]|uniref:DMT family transporter n=1 Tax=Natrialba sp. INN-245 TaxID=2690967 RepID=UPI0013106B22|nr:EamA family transporter [Natrialba sp. INN-245]MWV38491.1 EamA family transporter [Natrialba sp. INN-245]